MPAWFNDKAALAVLPHYGVPLRDARNYVATGCVEMAVPGQSPLLLGSGFLSLARCLELALHNGVDPHTARQIRPSTGDARTFQTYEELYEAFKKQLTYFLDLMNDSYNMAYAMHSTNVPVPFLSSLMDDCLSRGKDISQGGGRYNGLVLWAPREIVDTANSLAARKNPEEYRDLVVRVAGFSMFWVDLPPDVQDEIIARTEHSF